MPVFRFGISALTLDGHSKGVNYIDYFMRGSKQYLVSGSDDHTAKVRNSNTFSYLVSVKGKFLTLYKYKLFLTLQILFKYGLSHLGKKQTIFT